MKPHNLILFAICLVAAACASSTMGKKEVRIGIVINDIHRNWFSYYSIKLLTKLFSKSAMVKFDAPLSVLRAFKKNELKSILDQAGFSNYTLKWMWAFRWQVIIYLGTPYSD